MLDLKRYWQQKAEVAREMAALAECAEDRAALLSIAADYLRAASRAEVNGSPAAAPVREALW